MSKALLVSYRVESDMSSHDVVDINGRLTTTVQGPIRYEYNLTYVSYEMIDTRHFPIEIDTEKEETQKEVNSKCKLEKID